MNKILGSCGIVLKGVVMDSNKLDSMYNQTLSSELFGAMLILPNIVKKTLLLLNHYMSSQKAINYFSGPEILNKNSKF